MKIHNITFRYSVLHMKIVYLTHEVVTNKDHTSAAVQASNSQLHPDASSSLQLFITLSCTGSFGKEERVVVKC